MDEDDIGSFKILDDNVVMDRLGGRGLFRSKATGGNFASSKSRRFSAVSFKPGVTFQLPNDQERLAAIAKRQARKSIMTRDEKIEEAVKRRSSVSHYSAKPARRHSTIVYQEGEVIMRCLHWSVI
jgi:hypothetical protein